MESKIDKIFASCNDFELCDGITVVIENLYGFENLCSNSKEIPQNRRYIHFLWSIHGLIEGDGYTAFWAMECDHHTFVKALKMINMPILSEIAQKSLDGIPESILGNWDALEDHFGGPDGFDNAADLYDAKFIDENPDIQGHLSSYIRDHRYDFDDIIDELEEQLIQSGKIF